MTSGASARGAAGTGGRSGRNAETPDAAQLHKLLAALEAMRDGNFRRRLPVHGDGLMAEMAAVFNQVAERNQHLTSELSRVRRTVGREGKLTERLEPGPLEGSWSASVAAANELVEDLTRPLSEVGGVLSAVAEGDLSERMDLRPASPDGPRRPLRGEFLKVGRTVNGLVDQLSAFTAEVTRVASEVGTEGKLGGQAKVRGASGSWKDLTDSVNTMATQLTSQVRDIALVTTAVARGDLSRKVTVHVAGEMAELKATVNTMVDQLSSFASEVTRVAREVGTEGQLGGQAEVPGVAGTWKDLTDSVNFMAGNLTAQVRDIAQVTTAVASGDLSQKITVSARGEVAQLAETINAMTETLRTFGGEVTRVAREVGAEGQLGGQAQVPGAAGIWKDLTDSVNTAFRNLTAQVRDIAQVTTAVADGDLSQKVTVDVAGEMLQLKNTVNTMVGQLSAFGDEVTRVAREVGAEGRLGGQAHVPGAAGTWKDLTDSVNTAFHNLTAQVRDIGMVTTAVANGDLSRKVTVDVAGEMLQLKNTVNTMVDQLSSFAEQVTRMARDVGTEGRLGGQAKVPGVDGVWRDLTDSVNSMAGNLTAQVRNIAQVTTAIAEGDLSQKITVEARGEMQELKSTINTMVDQLSSFADEVTRVAREVGTEGQLGGQALVPGVGGLWRDLTDSVNSMAGNLTAQVRNIAQVATAVARGDLSQKITVDAKGEIRELKNTLNTMVDQLSSFADQVTLVAREVGTEGQLGGQADVKGVSGTWKDLTENVNQMASNLTTQVRSIAEVASAIANGDLSQKITIDAKGEILALVTTINTMVDQLSSFADEVTRVAREVGTEGQLGGQAHVKGVSGTWKDLTENVNQMASNLTTQVRSIAAVAGAVANGDLSKDIDVEAQGEIAELAGIINTMVGTLSAFADQVTRVAREVGTEGRLGGQAQVPGVSGTWRDLTESVNQMASNLTGQVRNISMVTKAVAQGDLTKKIDVDAQGEMLELKTTLNTMVDQLSSFASEVTRVAREVGIDGRLGGQARVRGVAGTWQDLTDNVNQLADNLTRQMRAIAQVAIAVTRGDLSLSIDVDASGELAELKDNINQMIVNLRETTRANQETDWRKTNLARISGLLQGRRDLDGVAQLVMGELTPVVSAQQGAFFVARPAGGETDGDDAETTEDDYVLEMVGSYGHTRESRPQTYRMGEGLIGQAAVEKHQILVQQAPPGYLTISSGLGQAPASNLLIVPVLFEGRLLGVIEIASFNDFSRVHQDLLEQIAELIAVTLNTISVNLKTEELLGESRRLAGELQERSDELESRQSALQRANVELEERAAQLSRQNRDIEIKNREIEEAKQVLEERARQLAQASQYKSEFLANMSHELRTPLNSLLILAKLLADNAEGNLSPKQVEFAEIIYGAGSDLLQLINDILDISKVEAGRMDVRPSRIALVQLVEYVEATFRPLTMEKGLDFKVSTASDLPATLHTDEQRLQQVLRNLLSNAVKFTDSGSVELVIRRPEEVPVPVRELLLEAGSMRFADDPLIAFSVADTGIGIEQEKLDVIFEPFKQADGGTARKYGGTGLGLSISQEYARLLGGEVYVETEPGRGSTFTLYLPLDGPRQPATGEAGGGGELPAGTPRNGLPAGDADREQQEEDDAAGAEPEDAPAAGASPVEQWTREVKEAADRRRHEQEAQQAAAGAEQAAAAGQEARDDAQPAGGTAAGAGASPAPEDSDAPHDAPRAGSAAPNPSAGAVADRMHGAEVLIVDDDIRNVYALTSVLEQHGLEVLCAENGREGIEMLEQHDRVALVLMDIMMPEMDGYATMGAIRRMPQYQQLPIIALTAKAMKGDREKSLEAGASDYVTKPVDTDHLFEVMQRWLGPES